MRQKLSWNFLIENCVLFLKRVFKVFKVIVLKVFSSLLTDFLSGFFSKFKMIFKISIQTLMPLCQYGINQVFQLLFERIFFKCGNDISHTK